MEVDRRTASKMAVCVLVRTDTNKMETQQMDLQQRQLVATAPSLSLLATGDSWWLFCHCSVAKHLVGYLMLNVYWMFWLLEG